MRSVMRTVWTVLLGAGICCCQTTPAAPGNTTEPAAATPAPARSDAEANGAADLNAITIPAGTRIPLGLKQAISTKNAREGDPVYAETTFPFVMNDRVVVPAGTYIQGKITHVERAGRMKGRAEILMHFTSMIFPSGYTVMLPGGRSGRTATPGRKSKTPRKGVSTGARGAHLLAPSLAG
jgi:type IV secretion system protein VirB10